jgi:uncharacterized protein Yka (UPF0111/DUF47 family)
MAIKIDVPVGELLDKITILEIKSERIRDEAKLDNIKKELETLRATWSASPLSRTDLSGQVKRLKSVNEAIWDIEDGIRAREAIGKFDDEFIQLARSVYINNDERAAIKREINGITASGLMEEKSYTDYTKRPE